MPLKIVIIGGVAGGASAAAKARRVNEQAEITLFERGPFVSFANCGLPYYIGDEIPDRESLFLQTPEKFWQRFRVHVQVNHEVLRIDRTARNVEVKNRKSGEVFKVAYDKLVLSPGAGAIIPPLPGIQAKNIFTVKTVPDSDAIKGFIADHHPQRAIVVGAGFIGLEAAEALKRRGMDVTIVEMLPQVLPPFDPDMAAFVSKHLVEQGLHVVLSDGIKAFHGDPVAKEIELQSGRRLPADLIILSIGVRPELTLAKEAGLEIGKAGGIAVNESQQTSDPDIYAAGDAVETIHLVTGQRTRIPLAGPANKQGRVAGANAAGGKLIFPGALGTAIVESMGITAAKTGLSEREAKQAGIANFVSITHTMDHAGYYPGAELVHIKLLTEEGTGRLLGAQVIGEQGVDKRIDILATALAAHLKVTDLENLDLAYAPQFSAAKDPVIMAGFVAANVMRGEMPVLTCAELQERMHQKEELQLIDVRTPQEYRAGHLEGAQLIPVDELRGRVRELNPQKETVVYCRVGFRGYLAARILKQLGFGEVRNLTGGILICPDTSAPLATPSQGNVAVSVLREVLGKPETTAIDVREPDEYFYEHIAGTQNVPLNRGMEGLSTLSRTNELYVFCQSGVRTRQALEMLRSAGFSQVHGVDGGLDAWKAAGFPVKRTKGPIPIMRQVQIVAGSLALIGGLIPSVHWIAAVVGAGLVFAGISGICGMANLLYLMPWNKIVRGKPDAKGGTCNP